jgi:O-antigen ligase
MKLVNIRSLNTARAAAAAASAVAVCAIFAAPYVLARASTSQAVGIRWMFLETTSRMLRAHPLIGVGVGQYAPASERFSPPELRAIYARENAHNNFAQIAGELGLPGLVAFVMLLASAFRGVRRASRRSSRLTTVAAGVAAFVLTWLGGHPLLVPAVAYPFWLALGIVAGSSSEIISGETDA